MTATVAAPIARIVVHWLAWTSTWFGLKDHDTLVSFGVVCGRACGVEVTLLALIVLCARMGEASESLSEKFGGCVDLDDDERQCFTATLRVEHGAWIALGGDVGIRGADVGVGSVTREREGRRRTCGGVTHFFNSLEFSSN